MTWRGSQILLISHRFHLPRSLIVTGHLELVDQVCVLTPNVPIFMHLDPRWWGGEGMGCERFNCLAVFLIHFKTSIVLSTLIPIFLLSHRAPVRAILPYTAPCLPRRIFRTRMSTVLNLDRRLPHPETLYLGTCRDMSGPRGKSREDPCWIRRRELCSGSQVRGSLLNMKLLDSNVQ